MVPLESSALAAEASQSWSEAGLQAAIALEADMQQQDAEEAAKADARNALESFILSVCTPVAPPLSVANAHTHTHTH